MREFKRLAPQFAMNGPGRPLDSMLAMVAVASSSPGQRLASDTDATAHSALLRSVADALKAAACDCDPAAGPVTLSAEAASKLQQILKLIEGIEPAVQEMEAASKELTDASGRLGVQTRDITKRVRQAISLLVDADLLDLSKRPGASDLRAKAVIEIEQAAAKIKDLENFPPPTGLAKTTSPLNDSRLVPLSVMSMLLSGTAAWVRNDDATSSTNTGGVSFVTASYHAGVMDKIEQIHRILAELIPKPTGWRVWKLSLQKASAAIYSASDQFRIFYNLLPQLPSPNEVDLYSNDDVRRDAARRLAQI